MSLHTSEHLHESCAYADLKLQSEAAAWLEGSDLTLGS